MVMKTWKDVDVLSVALEDVERAIQEWSLIQRFVKRQTDKGIMDVEEIIPSADVEKNLQSLTDIKVAIEARSDSTA